MSNELPLRIIFYFVLLYILRINSYIKCYVIGLWNSTNWKRVAQSSRIQLVVRWQSLARRGFIWARSTMYRSILPSDTHYIAFLVKRKVMQQVVIVTRAIHCSIWRTWDTLRGGFFTGGSGRLLHITWPSNLLQTLRTIHRNAFEFSPERIP